MISRVEFLKNRLANITLMNTATWGVFKAYAFFYLKFCPIDLHGESEESGGLWKALEGSGRL